MSMNKKDFFDDDFEVIYEGDLPDLPEDDNDDYEDVLQKLADLDKEYETSYHSREHMERSVMIDLASMTKIMMTTAMMMTAMTMMTTTMTTMTMMTTMMMTTMTMMMTTMMTPDGDRRKARAPKANRRKRKGERCQTSFLRCPRLPRPEARRPLRSPI